MESDQDITFILLSLVDAYSNIGANVRPDYTYYNRKIEIAFTWKHKTYQDLFQIIKKCHGFKDLDRQIVDDYCKFVEALFNLASNCWKINLDESYRCQIFPWGIQPDNNAEAKRREIEEYKKLRIHDIHEKLLYNQLLSLLDNELEKSGLSYNRFNQKSIQEQADKEKDKRTRIFTFSGYAHGIGIFEAQYVLSIDFKPQKKEIFKVIIQIQGDRYCRMVICDNVVSSNKNVNKNVLASVWQSNGNLKGINGTIDKYITIDNSEALFPLGG